MSIIKATWIETLICQYATEAHTLERYRDTLDLKDPAAAEEAETVSGMLADMRYALTWMRRGRRPGSRRGAERTDVYRQRELLVKLAGDEMSNEEKLHMVDALLLLSDRERTCFLLYVAQGLLCQEISDKLGIAPSTVYMYVTRAKDKLKKHFPRPL
ncbi:MULTISPECIES: sigma-70 family RNA polymerase sigma factor [unclassified Paenibacillus]|uniref:sigma-70 family RNA polymerase sigma factor n=1 Tax=unclassified Paenibacillus TaxID=185978 RepID=UPI002405C48A|nr:MULTISPECIES: sigma-70 family RNA polymerase sigma factor [unclassified Paenibacillus]MDF9845187.1 RNA polymerase sigma factor (sigma-70 family) [Paenibacillus sp. PastF-2]MDF9850321.1 RNA polymerase sigma factor (sigma-70 family) [Paenibacillus sp. PastM-2]MDF9856976.1 RNA polymerase sigma factor (sigma-70 family) [Paenibacillus sp. PastF-1]MDH6482167.1 RNA polymerase sigma factor (sigma-70 family) [Paenibacillus sp. PastH-2]MDH6509669.1 RNA polymerase sigma factor (sigma-70 family) [Paeni